MSLNIRLLPVVERWDCHGCGICCRGVIIPLDDEELKRLADQKWDEDPQYRGTRILVRSGWFKPTYRLAHRPDGYCVFFTAEGRCRIHELHGEAAKPLVCRMFPYQLVPVGEFAYLTLRRNSPSAATGRGRPLADQEDAWQALCATDRMAPKAAPPPAVTRRYKASWKDTLRVLEVLQRLVTDAKYPLVRRLVHGLAFCDALEACRLNKLERSKFAELLAVLEGAIGKQSAEVFREREAPSDTGGFIFRRIAADYLRLHPKYKVANTWLGRWQWATTTLNLAWGRGRLAGGGTGFPTTTLDDLDRPLGHLGDDVLKPLNEYFESMAISKRYAVRGRIGWSAVERFRALAASYAIALWLVRWTATGREPTQEDFVDAVIAVDRGEGYGALTGGSHRRRISGLHRLGQLPRLVAWYAR